MEPTTDASTLCNDLAMYAARVVRLIRQTNPAASAGVRTMSILDQHGPVGVTTLAQLDNCSQPTMTGIVRQLMEQGHVTREPHPSDARSSLIVLTDVGRTELARVRGAYGELMAARLTRHPEHSLADLATAVAVLRDVLAEPTTPDTPTSPKIKELNL